MSATAPTSTTSAASERLTRAIGAAGPAARARVAVDAEPASPSETGAPIRRVRPAASAANPAPIRDTARGAKAAPDAASDGAAQVMPAGQPGNVAGYPASAPTPYEASTAAYAAQAGATADPYAGRYVDASAPDPIAAPSADVPEHGGWSTAWQQEFERLRLAPADIQYLANSGYSDADLAAIAAQLAAVAPIQAGGSPVPGVDAGSAASANGPLPADGSMAPVSAWTPEWEQRFGDLMRRMGMSEVQVREQVASIEGQPVTAQQLEVAYQQMEASLGAFDDGWKTRFETLLDELETPADERAQVLQQLASGGLTDAQLTEIHSQMEQTKPAWDPEWENRFKTLGLPEELLTQLRDSGAPEQALEQQFQSYLDTKMKYKENGGLERLEDAKATPAEKWGVMLEGLDGEKLDKAVEQIHSQHVPGWKRVLGIAVNLIPGVYAAQYLTGKDWVTGEKIDRSNPLNIIGAVASGFAGFSLARGALNVVRSGGALWQASRGASLIGGTLSRGASNLGAATVDAVNGARVGATLLNSSKAGFQLRALVGSVARVGEFGRVAGVARGYGQAMQLGAAAMATSRLADGSKVIDPAVREAALRSFQGGGSIDDALAATATARQGLGGITIGDEAIRAGWNANGYVQRGGAWRFNPFKQDATMTAKATADGRTVWELGRGINFGTSSGTAIGMGTIEGTMLGRAGVSGAAVERVGEVGAHVARWADELGVAGGSPFRSLQQLGAQGRAVAGVVRRATHGGETGYEVASAAARLGSRYGGFVSAGVVGGAAVGVSGTQVQPMWEYVKDRKEIQGREAEARAAAEQEAADLERLYAEQQAAAAGGAAPAPGVDAGSATSGVPTGPAAPAPAAGEAAVYVDPATGMYVDPQTGMRANPATGEVYDAQGRLIGNVNQPAA